MAAGDRYKSGKPTDYVRHIWGSNQISIHQGSSIIKVWDGKTVCGRSDVGWAIDKDWSEVTCLKCLAKKPKIN